MPWLEYSVKLDAVFCFYCRMFSTSTGNTNFNSDAIFVETGFRNWKKVILK